MDIVGYGSDREAREYAAELGKKHGGQFKPDQLTREEHQKLLVEQRRLLAANGGRYLASRPFMHHAGWLSDALREECGDAADQEGHAKNLREQLLDLQRKVEEMRPQRNLGGV